MKYDPQIHHRRSIRLKEYDYTQAGAYFITICSHQRGHVFGEIIDGEMKLNPWGEIARAEWFKTTVLRPYVELHEDEFVVMPNHAHGIMWLNDDVGARHRRAPTEKIGKPVVGSIPTIVRAYKSAVTHAINGLESSRGCVVWQRNYYEHVIRNERELSAIARYIYYNPFYWQLDRDNLDNISNLTPPETGADYLKDAEEMMGVKTS